MKNPPSNSGPLSPPVSTGTEVAVHAIWTGTISFSLVAIPVHLVKAVDPGRVSFHLLHSKDHSPLVRKMLCPQEEVIISPDEIIRGYEIAPGEYLPITDEELESLSPERSRTIEIVEFIDLQEVDPIYYDRPYYLVPAKGGEKAYRLLAEVMARTNKAGLAKFVLHEREYLVAVKSSEGALLLITLHYSEEILPDEALEPAEEMIDAEAQNRLKQSIKSMLADFNPGKYADDRRQKLLDLLKQKEKEQGQVEAPIIEEAEGAGPPDLIAALEESMRQLKRGMRRVKRNR